MPLHTKIVLVTGAARGLGRAFADALLTARGTCVLVVRAEADVDRLRVELSFAGERVVLERADIARPEDVAGLAARVRDRFGRVDLLVNNAGVYLDADRETPADALDPAVLRETLATNLFGTIAMCRAFAPSMPRGGRIVNLGSRMGQLDGGIDAHSTAYSVSKTALNAYTSSLAAALAPRGIRADRHASGLGQDPDGRCKRAARAGGRLRDAALPRDLRGRADRPLLGRVARHPVVRPTAISRRTPAPRDTSCARAGWRRPG